MTTRPTLGQTFFVATAAILVVVAIAVSVFVRESRASILAASERLRQGAARRAETEALAVLADAEAALSNVDRAIARGAVDPTDTAALEVALWRELADSARLAEVTFSGASLTGYEDDGDAKLAETGRYQVSVHRRQDGGVVTRITRQTDRGFATTTREREPDAAFAAAPFTPGGAAADPTLHPTFSVLAKRRNHGRTVWSDLHYSELDQGKAAPRVVLSVQKAVDDASGRFAGVVRVALLTSDLDAIARIKVEEGNPADPHRVALLAASEAGPARLVARVGPSDRVEEVGDELRVVPAAPPPELAALLTSPLVRGLDPEHPNGAGSVEVSGQRYLATLRELPGARGGTVGWFVAIVVPEAHYTADLSRFEHLFAWVFGGTLLVVLAIGVVTLGAVRRGLASVVEQTSRMRRFDFGADGTRSAFRELDDVLLGLERAKTVMRALGKYVPVDLVKWLYERNAEPELGGELRDVSILFTDIEGFTTLAERLAPDELARKLGAYLEAMTEAVARTSGTIDKYIGDAVMAFWNAPGVTEQHAAKACEAVLECKRATSELFSSAAWKGLPALVTRYGLHRANVMVGHFGAARRMSYTALGDGVNLAARLEPLCKQYGVTALVSEDIVKNAGDAFVFRCVDRVAVKGKTAGIDVYELLGRRADPIDGSERHARYEEAFAAYLKRDFDGAARLLESQLDDGPSRVLSERCRLFLTSPPPASWNGVYTATSK